MGIIPLFFKKNWGKKYVFASEIVNCEL